MDSCAKLPVQAWKSLWCSQACDWTIKMFRKVLPSPTLEQIVQRARILVVDDGDFPYEELFRDEGYNITKWDNIVRIGELEQGNFDVVLLDLQGIGREISKDQGLGVLRHIKQVRPSQVVVAYSNADWGVQYQPFFELADRVLPKNADYVDFKREVNDLLLEHFSIGFHLDRIARRLDDLGVAGHGVRSRIKKAVERRDPSVLGNYLRRRGIDPEGIQLALSMVQVAVGVAQTWISAS